MSHKCFISFKKEDIEYKDELIKILKEENVIEKSLDKTIDSEDGDYIIHTKFSNYTIIIYSDGSM